MDNFPIYLNMTEFHLDPREIELAYRISETSRINAFEEQYEWMTHYHQELKHMYKLLQNNLQENNIRIDFSFDEFRNYVYENTERHYNVKTYKKARLLI